MKEFKLICLLLLVCNLPALAQKKPKNQDKVSDNPCSKSNNPDDSLKKEDPLQIQLEQIKKDLAEINKSIRAGYEAELDRLQTLNPNLALIDTPTIEDYLQIGKDLYKDYGRVRSEDKKQQLAFKEAEEKGNIFKQAGYPDMAETYQPREFFAPQYEAVDQELMKRFAAVPELAKFDPIAFKVPPQPAATSAGVPSGIARQQGRGTTPQPSRAADANMDVQSQARDFREKVLAELDKIATKKIQESGRSPFLDKATRALSVGR